MKEIVTLWIYRTEKADGEQRYVAEGGSYGMIKLKADPFFKDTISFEAERAIKLEKSLVINFGPPQDFIFPSEQCFRLTDEEIEELVNWFRTESWSDDK